MERIEIQPPRWRMGLMVLGIIAFVVVGLLMMINGEMAEQAMGCLAVVFFGGGGAYALYAWSRGQGKLAIVPTGVELGLPGMTPRVLPWGDIEGFGVHKVAEQEFTTIKLKDSRRWLAGISQEEAAAAVRFFRNLGLMGNATVAVGLMNEEDEEEMKEMKEMLAGSTEVKSLLDILAYNRKTFGAEFLLGWTMRDRSAQDFAKFLEERKTALERSAP